MKKDHIIMSHNHYKHPLTNEQLNWIQYYAVNNIVGQLRKFGLDNTVLQFHPLKDNSGFTVELTFVVNNVILSSTSNYSDDEIAMMHIENRKGNEEDVQ